MRRTSVVVSLLILGLGLGVLLVVFFTSFSLSSSAPPPSQTVAAEVTATPPLCDFHSDQVPSAAAELERTGNPSTNVLAFATGFSASDGDILLTRLDGTSPITLTTHPARDSVPVWSPDGTRIAFTSYRDGGRSVYLMNQDGSGVTPIWHGQGGSWSPDGSRLVFVYNAGEVSSHLRQWNTMGITTLLQLDHSIALAQWSPDGSQILFTTYEENAWVWLVDSDGRNAAKLIKGQRPAWSPDGSFIAFRDEHAAIALIKPDGSCYTPLTSDLFSSDEPAWSPDGQQIIFVAKTEVGVANHLYCYE